MLLRLHRFFEISKLVTGIACNMSRKKRCPYVMTKYLRHCGVFRVICLQFYEGPSCSTIYPKNGM